jgi:hypothetical protein
MNFVGDLVGALKAQQEAIKLAMANGNCASFESYQRLVGEFVSLEKVLLTIDKLLEEEKNVDK